MALVDIVPEQNLLVLVFGIFTLLNLAMLFLGFDCLQGHPLERHFPFPSKISSLEDRISVWPLQPTH